MQCNVTSYLPNKIFIHVDTRELCTCIHENNITIYIYVCAQIAQSNHSVNSCTWSKTHTSDHAWENRVYVHIKFYTTFLDFNFYNFLPKHILSNETLAPAIANNGLLNAIYGIL